MDRPYRLRYFALEIVLSILAIASALVFVWVLSQPGRPDLIVVLFAGITFLMSLVATVRLIIDPDTVRARQTDAILSLAGTTLACMQDGLTLSAAQKICEYLLPATSATAVAITDRSQVLGYAGIMQGETHGGSPIKTQATQSTLEKGVTHILFNPEEIGFPSDSKVIRAGIVVPLTITGKTVGTLKLYFRSSHNINETQISIAEGFGELLSTQMAAIELEEQTKLATRMELKALQSQINPHFLFNTINTIASFIRTDPDQARVLLREFAVFYRRTLENSSDLIAFEKEIDQVKRYFTFETARFGSERLELIVDSDEALDAVIVPAFMIQPLVENAVRHAMPSQGKLRIVITGEIKGEDLIVRVCDNGRGMSPEALDNLSHPHPEQGLGIAVKNINDRIKGFYGQDSYMDITSELGKGTQVELFLHKGACRGADMGVGTISR